MAVASARARWGEPASAGVHYLLIAALERAGLGFKDIEPAYLTPADAERPFRAVASTRW